MIQLYLFLPLLVFFFAGILLLLVLHGKSRSRVHRMFALLLLALGLWGLTIFGMRSSSSLGAAIAWERFALTAVLAVSLFFYHFTVLFTQKKAEAYLLPSLYLLTPAATGLVAAGMVVPEMELAWYGYAPRPGQFFIPYLAVVYSINFLGIWNLVRYYRNPPSEAARNRTIYILPGVGCSLLGGLVDSLPPLMSTYPIGMLGNLLLAFFTAVAILKHNLLDARVVIKKGVVYSIVIPFHLDGAIKCAGRSWTLSSIQPHPASERTRPGSDSISLRKAFTAATFSSIRRYSLPSTHRRTSSNTRSAGLSSGLYGGCTIVGTPTLSTSSLR